MFADEGNKNGHKQYFSIWIIPGVNQFESRHQSRRLFSEISVSSVAKLFDERRHRGLRGHGEEAKKMDSSGADRPK